jgi:predicted transcriptional regulator
VVTVTADLARLTAAQAKADEVVAAIAETPDGGPLLRVAVTDAETGQRLATCFVTYQVDGAPLRLVAS